MKVQTTASLGVATASTSAGIVPAFGCGTLYVAAALPPCSQQRRQHVELPHPPHRYLHPRSLLCCPTHPQAADLHGSTTCARQPSGGRGGRCDSRVLCMMWLLCLMSWFGFVNACS